MWHQKNGALGAKFRDSAQLIPPRLTETREAMHFANEVVPRTGVVVEANHARDYAIAMTVVDFEHRETVYVLPQCFTKRKNPSSRSQILKDDSYYNVLDNVSFDVPTDGIVGQRVSAANKMLIVAMDRSVFTVECICVLKVTDGIRCYTEILGDVDVLDPKLVERVVLDNVTFKCLVAFDFKSMYDIDLKHPSAHPIKYWLHRIIEVCPESLETAFYSSWMPKRCLPQPASDDEEDYLNQEPARDIPKKQVYNAYLVSPTAFYILDRPYWEVHLALDAYNGDVRQEQRRLTIGDKIVICAAWSAPLQKYIAYDITQPSSSGRLNAKFFKRDGYDCFRGYVNNFNDCNGLYILDGGLGIVVDRWSILAGNRKKSHFVDMRYDEPEEGSFSPIIICGSDNPFDFTEEKCTQLFSQGMGIYAVCVAPGKFFCKELPYMDLFSKKEDEIVGVIYKVQFVRVLPDYVVEVAIEAMANEVPVPIKIIKRPHETIYEFWVRMQRESVSENLWIPCCVEFGVVNIPENLLSTTAHTFNGVVRFKSAKGKNSPLRPFLSRVQKLSDAPQTFKFNPLA
uniref:Tudor domain-containing protein n=1 Tax=Panagrellus redivivus TaxID=6233 RepID=A0A7E4VNA1_PANRE